MIGPTTQQERYRFLDVLRGVALLGILPANIPLYGLPISSAEEVRTITTEGWAEPLAFYLTGFFVEYKFITIFSLLFGVGLALIHERCVATGRSFYRLYSRRVFVLALFAAGHIVLLWMGDILLYYAVLGFLAMWMMKARPGLLAGVGAFLISVPVMLLVAVGMCLLLVQNHPLIADAISEAMAGFTPQHQEGPLKSHWIFDGHTFSHFGPEVETAIYQGGSFLQVAALRVVAWGLGLVGFGVYFCWRVLGLFLVGMALLKAGWFVRPEQNMARFRKMGVIGAAFGIPLQGLGLVLDTTDAGGWGGAILAEGMQYAGSLGMSALYVALVAWLYVHLRRGRWQVPFAAVGQTALTNYILHSVFCSLFFYSYGLAMFGHLNRLQLWLVVVSVWAVELIASPIWLRWFWFGPLEWLWRVLTYGRLVPMVRRPAAAPAAA